MMMMKMKIMIKEIIKKIEIKKGKKGKLLIPEISMMKKAKDN